VASQKRQRKREGQAARRAALEAARKRQEQRKRFGVIGIIVFGVLVVAFVITRIAGGDSGDDVATTSTTASTEATTDSSEPAAALPGVAPVPAGRTVTGTTPCPKADGSEQRASKFEQAPPMCINPAKTYTAIFDTSAGVVKAKLDLSKTPATANNFVVLARYHYYDGSSFHRTATGIDIIQGGAPSTQSAGDPGPGYTIKDEPPQKDGKGDYKYTEGDLVMARTGAPDSAGGQYFFSAGPGTKSLDVLKKVLATHKECPAGADEGSCTSGKPDPAVTVNTITIEES
jgi:cyclophilin family peptidyl-prolyl cis-trans isomerase